MFPHYSQELNLIGAKFRLASHKNKEFSSRGKLGFYILEHIYRQDPVVVISESETSSNSIWELMKANGINGVVLSIGGVNFTPPRIPYKYSGFTNRFLVIDYDGDDKLYRDRVNNFSHLSAIDIPIRVDKGDDVNSLWVKRSDKLNEIVDILKG